jgi:hypothetical protein
MPWAFILPVKEKCRIPQLRCAAFGMTFFKTAF